MKARLFTYLGIVGVFTALSLHSSDSNNPNWCGNKHKNLVILNSALAGMANVSVPEFIGITSARVEAFLKEHCSINALYQQIITDLNNGRNGERDLTTIQTTIEKIFNEYPFPFTPDEQALFARVAQQGKFFMVRSTGIEDSQTVANAGGNVSVAYVQPNAIELQKALGQVVASYFGMQSLKNRLAGGETLSATLCLPGLIQLLIGEPLGGSNNQQEIPVSGVAFTTNQGLSCTGFAVTEINASYGHGEGIVANRVVADRYYVTPSRTQQGDINIYPMMYKKEFRLVPTQERSTGRYTLSERKNNSAAVHTSALTTQQIKHLYNVLKTIERSYKQPMDVEFVFADNHLYIVQARPAMRHTANPSFCNIEALADGDISEPLDATTLVSGNASVLVITNPADVIITKTLDEADQMPNSATCKAVIVGAWASSLSHAAVNFISHGIPCMYVHDFNAMKKLVSQISPTNPLILDPQRRIVCLWQNSTKTIQAALQKGWFEHPIDRTLSLITQNPTLLPTHANPMPQDGKLITLLDSLKTAKTAQQKKTIVDSIEQRVKSRFDLTERRIANAGSLCPQPFKDNFVAFKQKFERTIAETQKSIAASADHFELLFYHKMLEALLFQSNDTRTAANAYTYTYFLDDLFANNGLFIQQRKLGTNLLFTQEYTYDSHCPSRDIAQLWREFLVALETEAKKSDIAFLQSATAFKQMLSDYNQLESLPLWFATEFYAATMARTSFATLSAQGKLTYARTTMKQWADTYTKNKDSILNLQTYKSAIATINTKRGTAFNSESDIKNITQRITDDVVKPMTDRTTIQNFKNASLSVQMIACQVMHSCIDMIDTTIKAVKTNSHLPERSKRLLLAALLDQFNTICHCWLKDIMPINALSYHGSWPLQSYLQRMNDLYGAITRNLKNGSTNGADLQKSVDFSVNAAMLGSRTAFERHYPRTVEDIFMLIHQNSLVAVAATYGSLLNREPLEKVIYLPESLKQAIAYIESSEGINIITRSAGRPSRIGIAYNTDTITVSYNMPLRNHSSTFQVIYHQATQQCTLSVQFLGDSRNRWEQVAILGNLSPDLSKLELSQDVVFDRSAGFVSCSWVIKDTQSLKTIIQYLATMAELSFEINLDGNRLKQVYFGPDSLFNQTAYTALTHYIQKHGSNRLVHTLVTVFAPTPAGLVQKLWQYLS